MIGWLTTVLDVPAESVEDEVSFWERATDSRLSAWRGERAEFATFQPTRGDAHLRVQRLDRPGDGPCVHLDVHVLDLRVAARRAAGLGARRVEEGDDVMLMASPGGLPFCFVELREHDLPPVSRFGSVADQVCLDIDSDEFDREGAFWSAVTGWAPRPVPEQPEFYVLVRPDDQPVRMLLQRRREPGGAVTAHLDLSTRDRGAEVDRLRGLGAEEVLVSGGWTTMRDPAGLRFCVTDRVPRSR